MEYLKLFETNQSYLDNKSILPYPCVSYVEETDSINFTKESIISLKYYITPENAQSFTNEGYTDFPFYIDLTREGLKAYELNGEKVKAEKVEKEVNTITLEFVETEAMDDQTSEMTIMYLPKSDFYTSVSDIDANYKVNINRPLMETDYLVMACNLFGRTIISKGQLNEGDLSYMFNTYSETEFGLTHNYVTLIKESFPQDMSLCFFFADEEYINGGHLTNGPSSISTTLLKSKVSGGIPSISIPLSSITEDTEINLKLYTNDKFSLSSVYNTIGKYFITTLDTSQCETEISIDSEGFRDCSRLTSITLGNSVTSIDDYAFSGCTNLPVIDNIRYADTYLVGVTNKSLSSYNIKEGTKWIGNNAFSGCTSLTSITIQDSVTYIGNYAFYDCSSLTSIEIPDSVTSIGSHAFYNCSSLTSITLGNSVTSIGSYAFADCRYLTSINILDSVTSIGYGAFSYCRSLTSITCLATTAPSITYNTFQYIASHGVLSVPSGSDYSSWMSNDSYYLGYYSWKKQEI